MAFINCSRATNKWYYPPPSQPMPWQSTSIWSVVCSMKELSKHSAFPSWQHLFDKLNLARTCCCFMAWPRSICAALMMPHPWLTWMGKLRLSQLARQEQECIQSSLPCTALPCPALPCLLFGCPETFQLHYVLKSMKLFARIRSPHSPQSTEEQQQHVCPGARWQVIKSDKLPEWGRECEGRAWPKVVAKVGSTFN